MGLLVEQSKKVAMKVGWGILICCIAILFDLNDAFLFRRTDPNRHAFRDHDALEKWGDWTSPRMLTLLLRATQKAQRLMAYKKKKNNQELKADFNLAPPKRPYNQDLILEQQVKRPQARPQRKTVPIFNQFSTLF